MALQAGIGKRDITPPVGTPLAGRPQSYPTYSIHDPLRAKACFLASDTTAAVLITTDLLLLEYPFAIQAREKISETFSIPVEAIVLCTTHTHTGPGVGDWVSWEGREAYEQNLLRNIVDAAREAHQAAQPATLSYAASQRKDLSHNRRYVMQDGSVETHPDAKGALRPDGPIDPEIQAVLVSDNRRNPLAVLVGFACHPTAMGWKDNAISADYPCWIEQTVQAGLGQQTDVLFFPGALGDLSDGDPFIRHKQTGVSLASKIGQAIGQEVLTALETGKVDLIPELATNVAPVSVPTIDMGPERRQWAREVLQAPDKHPSTAVRDAGMVLDMWEEWPDEIATEIPLIGIGDLAFYGIPGELLCWYGLQLKKRSRFKYPFLLGLANDRIGYIADRVFPTKDIFNRPLNLDTRPFGKTGDAGERIVQAALEL